MHAAAVKDEGQPFSTGHNKSYSKSELYIQVSFDFRIVLSKYLL